MSGPRVEMSVETPQDSMPYSLSYPLLVSQNVTCIARKRSIMITLQVSNWSQLVQLRVGRITRRQLHYV